MYFINILFNITIDYDTPLPNMVISVTAGSDQLGSSAHIIGGMAAVVHQKHGIVHTLGSQLDGGHAIAFEQRQYLVVDTVGTGGDTDPLEAVDIRRGRVQQRKHIAAVDRGEAAAEEGDLAMDRIFF